MVSVPGINPNGQSVDFWWSARVGNVYKYSGGYQSVATTTPGEGYWMNNDSVQTYNTGDEWSAEGIQIVTHNPISANAGWNLIGGYENIVPVEGITTNPPGLQQGLYMDIPAGIQRRQQWNQAMATGYVCRKQER